MLLLLLLMMMMMMMMMMMFTIASKSSQLTRIWSCYPVHMSSALTHELNCIIFLDYKCTLPKCDINTTSLVGPEIHIIWKYP